MINIVDSTLVYTVVIYHIGTFDKCKCLIYNDIIRAVTIAATSRAHYFLVAPGLVPLLFEIDSAASILTTFKRCANR